MPVTQTISGAARRRGMLLLGLIGMTAGAGLLTAGFALAAVGSGPGQLQLSPATGALTTIPTWSTTTACPSGTQTSAQVYEYTLDGTFVSSVSNVVTGVTSPFSGLLLGNVGDLLSVGGVSASAPGTLEWVASCFSGAGGTGTESKDMSVFVTAFSSGMFSTCTTPGPSGCPAPSSSPSASSSPS
ncbi:MAG TPA: hypothetical protein VH520_03810, partial [Streptosporangiaceae bacterium]